MLNDAFASHVGYPSYKLGVRRLDISDFNAMDEKQARTALTRCCGSTRWVEAMLARRPFETFADLFQAADDVWWSLDRSDWLEAFSHHPKIGDLSSLRQKFAATADLSIQEQVSVNEASETVLRGLARGNAAYLEKFGYIFIVKAAGKSAADMLTTLQKRLRNDPDTEIIIAADQNKQIMTQRLSRWVTS